MKSVRYVFGALVAVLLAAPLSAQEQTGIIRGRIVDEAQQPIAGATVLVGTRSALSNASGQYVITAAPAGSVTLQVRMLGYSPVTRAVVVTTGQTSVVDVEMISQAVGLAEIVVTGYGEQRAGDITGAVTQVTTEQFNPGRIVSPAQLISSKVAGVQVVDNNEPGGGISIRIRGATSVTASNEPLYVIDGVPVGTGSGGGLSAGRDPLNFLNPDDIESIVVLRDARSSSTPPASRPPRSSRCPRSWATPTSAPPSRSTRRRTSPSWAPPAPTGTTRSPRPASAWTTT
jgi:iron complex outermembrane receptor protein